MGACNKVLNERRMNLIDFLISFRICSKSKRGYMNNSNIAEEIEELRSYNYFSLCQYLQKKYGEINGSYFVNENCKTKNGKIKRTSEGLFIHHIYENKVVMLSHSEYATHFPFEWQEGKNLVYCNYFEHVLLHVAIVKEFLKTEAKKSRMAVGIGGLLNFMFPEIIDYLNGYEYSQEYMKRALSVIDGNELLFIDILEDLKGYILGDPEVFSIVYDVLGRSRERFVDAFKNGKMTRSGRFRDLLFAYSVSKKEINLVDSKHFCSVVENALDKTGYDYAFACQQHGEYSYVRFDYRNRSGEIISKEYAVASNDKIDFDYLKEKYFRTIVISDRKTCLVKKESIVSFKENKESKNVNKRYSLTVDGIVVEFQNFTKEQAQELVEKNR